MKNWIRVTICIMLMVSILAMSLSVFADDVNPSPSIPPLDEGGGVMAVNEELLSYYIYLCLRSWGVNIQYADIDGFYDEVENQIINWVIQYLAGLPSAYSINEWIAPWQASFDYWGNYQFNSSALEDIKDFANWLKQLLGIQDNSIIVLNPNITVNGATVFESNRFYESEDYYKEGKLYVSMSRSNDINSEGTSNIRHPYWFIMNNPYDNHFYMIEYQRNTDNYEWSTIYFGQDSNGNVDWIASASQMSQETKYGYIFRMYHFWPNDNPSNPEGINLPTSFTPIVYNTSAWGPYILGNWLNSITNFEEALEGDNKIITVTVRIPEEGTDYNDGDSIVIIDDNPIYKPIEWDGKVSVENLPAIVSTGNIENPHLEEAYRPIQGLIAYAKDGIGVCTALLYELPDEIVYMWYGLIASIVLWGMIKLMREH